MTKTKNSIIFYYIWAGGLLLARYTPQRGETIAWFYDVNGVMLGFELNGTAYFYVRNLQGDIVKVLDLDGNVVAWYTYDAWGNILDYGGVLARVNPITYRGYYFDWPTGLYYLQSRYYDPSLRRFISADVFMDTGVGILGTNMYIYVNNDPINYVDSTGFRPENNLNPWEMVGFLLVFSVAIEQLVESILPTGMTLDSRTAEAFFVIVYDAIGLIPGTGREFMGNLAVFYYALHTKVQEGYNLTQLTEFIRPLALGQITFQDWVSDAFGLGGSFWAQDGLPYAILQGATRASVVAGIAALLGGPAGLGVGLLATVAGGILGIFNYFFF